MRIDDRLLTAREVAELTRLSKVTIYSKLKEGNFPKQLRIGRSKVAWMRSEILAWIEARAAERIPE